MIRKRSDLLSDALELPLDERAKLAAEIIESLDPGTEENVDEAWSKEIERRIAEVDSGAVQMIPWEEARKIIQGTNDVPPGTSLFAVPCDQFELIRQAGSG